MSAVVAQSFNNVSADHTVNVPALTAFELGSIDPTIYGASAARIAVGVWIEADGTLVYENFWGTSLTRTLKAGYHPIRIRAIGSATTSAVVLYI